MERKNLECKSNSRFKPIENRRISDDVAIEIIRSIKEIIFKLIEQKFQLAPYNNDNL